MSRIAGKKVTLFLADGDPEGVVMAELDGWHGRIIAVSRANLKRIASHSEISKPGVYVLQGEDSEIYIGQSDNVWKRLNEHDNRKDFWNKLAAIVSMSGRLDTTRIRYLEARLLEIAQQAGRAKLQNSNSPAKPYLHEFDIPEMENFVEEIRVLLPLLGFSFMKPIPSVQEDLSDKSLDQRSPIFEMIYSKASALAQEVDGEFVVKRDSLFIRSYRKSLRKARLVISASSQKVFSSPMETISTGLRKTPFSQVLVPQHL
jgi:hypothetical protein